jgi:hypothetical protein
MSTIHEVDPEKFVDADKGTPANGRGAWTRAGIGHDYRYSLSPDPGKRIGTQAQVSLDHWSAGAGSYAIQRRLVELGHLAPLGDGERGIFGPKTVAAVKKFQAVSWDPANDTRLTVDGIIGMSDARALFTSMVLKAELSYEIPWRLLLGETNHESVMDPGAIGYYIYYPSYRGIDRAMSQINSKFNPQVTWLQAYDPSIALDWSAQRLRTYYNGYRKMYPKKPAELLWDAAVCAHNSPANANKWALNGAPPNEVAAKYVASVKNAIY